MPRNRADELTYYDELGVPRDATSEQIREAFRALVRLLHPDHHTDEHLKSVAELQMRKLNRIHAVLSDPEKRRTYDDYLEEDHGPPTPLLSEKLGKFGNSRMIGRYAWLGAVGLTIALLFWLAADGPSGSGTAAERANVPAPRPSESSGQRKDMADEITRLRTDLRTALVERDSAMHELARLRLANQAASSSTSPPVESRRSEAQASSPPSVATLTELPVNPPAAATLIVAGTAARAATTAHLPARPFTGFWFFVKTQEDKKNPTLYPPEFIEATIVEQNGQVRGRYRSRYRIVDRAISPDVNFDFNGTINTASNTVTAGWTGAGGAHGELTLKLMGEHSIKVDWSADRLGSIQGLTAGTASLTRRLD